MIESRCGLICSTCSFKDSHGCGGCVETNGNPFHGECRIAWCCQDRDLSHCGECSIIPCKDLYAFSFLDPEHGDKPQGARVMNCRRWAAESGIHKWERVLLTSSGFETPDGQANHKIKGKFLELLGMPAEKARVLFIPTAAVSEEARYYAGLCRQELIDVGIQEENIFSREIDGSMTEAEVMSFDAVYFTGGSTAHLLERIQETGFDEFIKKMVYANKLYVGVSAGSIIAAPNINNEEVLNPDTAGLALVHAYISVHCTDQTARLSFPLPHLPLTDREAVWVTYKGYEVIEG